MFEKLANRKFNLTPHNTVARRAPSLLTYRKFAVFHLQKKLLLATDWRVNNFMSKLLLKEPASDRTSHGTRDMQTKKCQI